MNPQPSLTQHKVTVLLVDDQPMVGEAVRRMLVKEPDIAFHYCKDPTRAIDVAGEVGPTVILQDLVMPGVDGLTLVKLFRENQATRDTPLIVLSTNEEARTKAEAFALGANDYIVKLPDQLELLARIRYHSRGYINLLERNEAFQKLQASQQALADDVAQAARYVTSILPAPLRTGDVRTEWRFIPSTGLGGDAFGYHALDSRHFACYLLDVCGHGVGAALLSVSVLNALRSQSLPRTDFRKPGQVLTALNRAFPMEQHGGKFFTIWYGVLDREAGRLVYAGGGHPPALLFADSAVAPIQLKGDGPMIGAIDDLDYGEKTSPVRAGSRLLIYSDGAYEIHRPDGSLWRFEDFIQALSAPADGTPALDRLIRHISGVAGKDGFEDDVSLLEVRLD